MGSKKKTYQKQFEKFAKEGAVSTYARCKHCGWERAWNTTPLKNHLKECEYYLMTIGTQPINEPRFSQSAANLSEWIGRKRPPVSDDLKDLLDKFMILAIAYGNLPLSVFERNPYLRIAFMMLGYAVPSRPMLSNNHLDGAYQEVRSEVQSRLRRAPFVNICYDESDDVKKHRNVNVTALDAQHDSFYITNRDLRTVRASSENLANEISLEIQQLGLREGSLNAFVSDTCTSAAATGSALQELYPGTFWVPCDSHGLNLLIGDLLGLPDIKHTYDQALTIANGLNKSTLQLSILRDLQKEHCGKALAIVGSTKTRWATQIYVLMSLLRSKTAIQSFARDPRVEEIRADASRAGKILLRNMMNLIMDEDFWQRLECLLAILQPVEEEIKKSESNKASVRFVYGRWGRLRDHLVRYSRLSTNPFARDLFRYIYEGDMSSGVTSWTKRRNRQVRGVHEAAHYFNPANAAFAKTRELLKSMTDLFKAHILDPNEARAANRQWLDYINKHGIFGDDMLKDHEDGEDLKSYWTSAATDASALASFALRLLSIPATSVPSERAFSANGRIHDKERNRLLPARADRLTYIYMNLRTLNGQSERREARKHAWQERIWKEIMDGQEAWLQEDFEEDMLDLQVEEAAGWDWDREIAADLATDATSSPHKRRRQDTILGGEEIELPILPDRN